MIDGRRVAPDIELSWYGSRYLMTGLSPGYDKKRAWDYRCVVIRSPGTLATQPEYHYTVTEAQLTLWKAQ